MSRNDQLAPAADRLSGWLGALRRFERVGVWERDLRTGIGRWDDHVFRLYELEPSAGTPSMDAATRWFHPDDIAPTVATWRRSAEAAGRYDTHFRLRLADGRVKHLHSMWEVIDGVDGRPERAMGVLIDDTESVELARRQQQTDAQIALAAELVGLSMLRVDLATQRVWIGDAWYRDAGIAPRPEGMSLDEFRSWLHPDDRRAVEQAFSEALVDGPVELELRFRAADGRYRTHLSRRVVERDAAGRPVAMLGVSLDVTERHATEQRLRRAELRALLATKGAGMGVWDRDVATGHHTWDAQMYRLRKLEPDDPRSPDELRVSTLYPDDRKHVLAYAEKVIAGEAEGQQEFRIVWPDGTVRWLAARGAVVRDTDGTPVRLIGVHWDITEQRRNEDLRRERAAAEEASRAKSHFLARMSHELRTPLNAVLGFAQLLSADPAQPLTERQRERVQHIRLAGEHLLALINDTLDLASIEAGTLPLDDQAVELGPLVDDVLSWIEPAATQAGLALRCEPMNGAVRGDGRRVRQVLLNLLSNAVKYNRPQGQVSVRQLSGDDGRIGIEVSDSGRGMTPAQLRRLFEPFDRLGAERESIEGTGIGLSIVRHLVERMGGRVAVESRPGEGSRFVVWLRGG